MQVSAIGVFFAVRFLKYTHHHAHRRWNIVIVVVVAVVINHGPMLGGQRHPIFLGDQVRDLPTMQTLPSHLSIML